MVDMGSALGSCTYCELVGIVTDGSVLTFPCDNVVVTCWHCLLATPVTKFYYTHLHVPTACARDLVRHKEAVQQLLKHFTIL